jgi:lipoate-protein ligase B
VGYAIVDLEARGRPDATGWLRCLEGVLIDALAVLGVGARRIPGMTGVFLSPPHAPPFGARGEAKPGGVAKLASIGVGLRGWISWHGFALNVTTGPGAFADIVPCGLEGVTMTSLAAALGVEPTPALFDRARDEVAAAFRRALA